MSTPEISSSNEKITTDKIRSNQTDAYNAQNEYIKLQAKRDSE